jgi:hypothetical protein
MMDELLQIKLPINPIVKKSVKRKTITQHIMIRGHDTEVKTSSQPKMILSENTSFVQIRSILNNETYAFFQNRDDPTNDYFYLCLEDLKKQHIEFLGGFSTLEDVKYNSPHNAQGFKFKSVGKFLKCYDVRNNLSMWKDCVGKICNLKLRIRPYDIISKTTKKRCVGLSIKVSAVYVLRY